MADNKIYTIAEIKEIARPIFKQNNVERFWLFGSYAKGLANVESDIDFLYELTEENKNLIDHAYDWFINLKQDLEKSFDKEIHLTDLSDFTIMHREILQNINRDKIELS